MDHADHVSLLRGGIEGPEPDAVWADFGAGAGAFTLALGELLGPGAEIWAVDHDRRALRANAESMRARFPGVVARQLEADFTRALELPLLDGFVLANSLHFQEDQAGTLSTMKGYLKPGGRVLVVEYNIERGNFAVPHPVPFRRWEELARGAGFAETRLLMTRPSRFLHEIYSAVSW